MIFPLVLAIWFGYRARQAERNVLGWALGGALLTFLIATIITNLVAFVIAGSLPARVESGTFFTIRILGAVLSSVVTVLLGRAILPTRGSHASRPRHGEIAAVCARCGKVVADGGLSMTVGGVLVSPLCSDCYQRE